MKPLLEWGVLLPPALRVLAKMWFTATAVKRTASASYANAIKLLQHWLNFKLNLKLNFKFVGNAPNTTTSSSGSSEI